MIWAGFGFRHGATVDSLCDALDRARAGRAVGGIATLADKAGTPAFRALAGARALPVLAVSPDAAEATKTQTNSARVMAERQTGSVAEATALCAAGPGATLVQARVVSADRMATCALAEAPSERNKE